MTTTPLRIDGADISHHQQTVDLRAFKASGGKFLYHKVTEGESYVDVRYQGRRDDAHAIKLPFGGYHYAHPEVGDARAEATHFLEQAQPRSGELAPVLDLEEHGDLTQAELTRWVKTFADVIKTETGTLPILYTPFDLDDTLGLRLWVARYNARNEPPRVPRPWKGWDIRQFSNGESGVPNSAPGLGHVDLNVLTDGVTVRSLRIPARSVQTQQPVHIDASHVSMQFSDSSDQMRADADKIFSRAQAKRLWWVTGTEAGGDQRLAAVLMKAAAQYSFQIYFDKSTDAWVAVNEDVIDGDWHTYLGPIVVKGKLHDHTAKRVLAASFYNHEVGDVTVMAGHYLTKGRDVKDPEYNQHLDENRAFSKAIGDHARVAGRGSALVFYGGDQNIDDKRDDTFLGAPLTSASDELKTYENTGHGPIDVMASYDEDKRVSAVAWRVFDDREFSLNTDHFYCEARFAVRPKTA